MCIDVSTCEHDGCSEPQCEHCQVCTNSYCQSHLETTAHICEPPIVEPSLCRDCEIIISFKCKICSSMFCGVHISSHDPCETHEAIDEADESIICASDNSGISGCADYSIHSNINACPYCLKTFCFIHLDNHSLSCTQNNERYTDIKKNESEAMEKLLDTFASAPTSSY